MPSTAVILVDMQNAFFAPDGSLAQRRERVDDARGLIDRVNALIDLARSRHFKVIFTRLVFAGESSASSALRRKMETQGGRHWRYFADAADSLLVPDVNPGPDDLIIEKAGYDPFYGTSLESALRDAGVTRLLIGGVLTNVCVESCVRAAFERGFEVIVVEDATASYSPAAKSASLDTIRRGFGKVCRLADLVG